MSKTMNYKKIVKENKELRKVLEALVDHYVANRNIPDSEFISCIAPKHALYLTKKQRRSCSTWNAWDNARELLGDFDR